MISCFINESWLGFSIELIHSSKMIASTQHTFILFSSLWRKQSITLVVFCSLWHFVILKVVIDVIYAIVQLWIGLNIRHSNFVQIWLSLGTLTKSVGSCGCLIRALWSCYVFHLEFIMTFKHLILYVLKRAVFSQFTLSLINPLFDIIFNSLQQSSIYIRLSLQILI